MRTEDSEGCLGAIFVLLFMIIFSGIMLYGINSSTTLRIQKDAIEHKVGKYVIDENNEKKFVWVVPTAKE